MDNYRDIHIGSHIKELVKILEIDISKICECFKCNPSALEEMLNKKSLEMDLLLKWSKLLDYNLFVFYHMHLQLYAPRASMTKIKISQGKEDNTYHFKKNYYSPEIKKFIIDKVINKEYSIMDLVNRYNIPKTTVYRWLRKHNQ